MSAIFGEVLTFGQAQGPEIRLRVFGDELYARYEDLNGYTAIYDDELGLFCYAALAAGAFRSTGVPLDASSDTSALEADPSAPTRIYAWHVVRMYDAMGDADAPSPQPLNLVRYKYSNVAGTAYLTDVYDTPPAANAATAPVSAAGSTASRPGPWRLASPPRPSKPPWRMSPTTAPWSGSTARRGPSS